MIDDERIHPLKEVWLRPRRVSRALAREPLGIPDYVLAALQGVCNYLVFFRLQPDPKLTLSLMLSNALLYGAVTGVVVTGFYAVIYARLGARAGRVVGPRPVFHVLSYGSVPVVAALALSVGSALLVGDAVLMPRPGAELDGFVLLVDRVLGGLVILLYLWSYLLQVMGLSELFGLALGKAFALWILGQVAGALAALFFTVLLSLLFPSLVSAG